MRSAFGVVVAYHNDNDPEGMPPDPIAPASAISYDLAVTLDNGVHAFSRVQPAFRFWPDDLDTVAAEPGTPFMGVMRGTTIFALIPERPAYGDCDPVPQAIATPDVDSIISAISAMSPAQRAMIRTAAEGG